MGRLSGQVPEWSKGADLRSAVQRTRGFEPHPGQHTVGSGEERAVVSCGAPSLSVRTNKCGQTTAPIV